MSKLPYWGRLLRLFRHYRKKSTRLPYFPLRLWVELTSICNYRCIMCPNKDLEKQDKGYMSMDLYREIIDQAGEFAFDINLAHRGESLLHPNIAEAVRLAKKKGLYTRLHTNGSLLTRKLGEKIITAGLDRISFSFDGWTKETYEKIRLGGDFDNTLNNIMEFLRLKQELGSKTPEAAIEVIQFSRDGKGDSEDAAGEFRARFQGLPLDHFHFKELHNWGGEMNSEIDSSDYSLCPFPWNAMVICWDGTVLPCTQDFFGHYPLGNAADSALKDIWNSSRMAHLREKLSRREPQEFKTCSHCDRLRRKRIFGIPRENLWKFITKRMP